MDRVNGAPEGKAELPLVTVVVPVYNHALYVCQCLDSVIRSDYPDIELVIVDDASTDNSPQCVRTWLQMHPDVRAIFQQHAYNQGITRTLNEAVQLSHGEYMTVIASDDLLLPNGIRDRVQYLISHSTKWAVFADCRVIDGNGSRLYESGIESMHRPKDLRKSELLVDRQIPYNIVFRWGLPGGTVLYRRSTFEKIGGFDEELLIEDWDMALRLTSRNRLGFLDCHVSQYRYHGTNFSAPSSRSLILMEDMQTTARKNSYLFQGVLAAGLRAFSLQEECRLAFVRAREAGSLRRIVHHGIRLASARALLYLLMMAAETKYGRQQSHLSWFRRMWDRTLVPVWQSLSSRKHRSKSA